MAKKKADNKKKLLLFLALPALNFGYQIVAPYMAETKKIKEEAKKLNTQIRQVKSDALLFSEGWEKRHSDRESQIGLVLPEQIIPSEVLRYFATNFEKDHPGVQFTSLIPSSPTVSTLSADQENPSVKARVSKVQLKAKMPPEHLLSYLDYVEHYPGLSRVIEVGFNSQNDGKTQALDLEMAIELFLVPKEWLKKETTKEMAGVQRGVAAVSSVNGTGWFETKNMDHDTKPSPEVPVTAPMQSQKKYTSPTPPKFSIQQFVGDGIVIGEELFEEGDKIQGWIILKVEQKSKTVILQKDKSFYKVVVK